jgi:hypothetical protein
MNIFLNLARGYAIFLGASGFLFGQLLFGSFSVVATLAGVSGVLAGVFSWMPQHKQGIKRFTIPVCAAGIVGVATDAFNYYSRIQVPGNDYAWFLSGLFVAALLLIGYSAFSERGHFLV